MLAWTTRRCSITGSDDTTVRFWDLKRKALWGTFSAAAMAARARRPGEPAGHGHGLGLLHARRLLRRLRGGPEADPVPPPRRGEPAGAVREHALSLPPGRGAARRQAPAPGPGARRASPHLDRAPGARRPDRPRHGADGHAGRRRLDRRRASTTTTGRSPPGWRSAKKPFPEQLPIKTRLVKGTNRFHAMASREGAYSSISEPVEVDVRRARWSRAGSTWSPWGSGPTSERELKYAGRDASRISEVLHARGLDATGKPGMRIFLPDERGDPREHRGRLRQGRRGGRGPSPGQGRRLPRRPHRRLRRQPLLPAPADLPLPGGCPRGRPRPRRGPAARAGGRRSTPGSSSPTRSWRST